MIPCATDVWALFVMDDGDWFAEKVYAWDDDGWAMAENGLGRLESIRGREGFYGLIERAERERRQAAREQLEAEADGKESLDRMKEIRALKAELAELKAAAS